MTGWRVGWMIGPADVVKAATNLQSHADLQRRQRRPARRARRASPATCRRSRRCARRSTAAAAPWSRCSTTIHGVVCPTPQGAFYAYPSVKGAARPARSAAGRRRRRPSWPADPRRGRGRRRPGRGVRHAAATCGCPTRWATTTSSRASGGSRSCCAAEQSHRAPERSGRPPRNGHGRRGVPRCLPARQACGMTASLPTGAAFRPLVPTRSQSACAGCARSTAAGRPSTGSTSTSSAARCSRCSGRTAPARRRPSRSSRATGAATPARSTSSATTRATASRAGATGSASCCRAPRELDELHRRRDGPALRRYYPHAARPRRGHRRRRAHREGRRAGRAALSGGQRRRLDVALGHRRRPRAAVPRRADHRLRPAGAAHVLGAGRATCAAAAPRSCSPRTTWTRPSSSPTGSASSPPAGCSPSTPRQRSAAATRDQATVALARRRAARSAGVRPAPRPQFVAELAARFGGEVPGLEVVAPVAGGRLPVDDRGLDDRRSRRERRRPPTPRRVASRTPLRLGRRPHRHRAADVLPRARQQWSSPSRFPVILLFIFGSVFGERDRAAGCRSRSTSPPG